MFARSLFAGFALLFALPVFASGVEKVPAGATPIEEPMSKPMETTPPVSLPLPAMPVSNASIADPVPLPVPPPEFKSNKSDSTVPLPKVGELKPRPSPGTTKGGSQGEAIPIPRYVEDCNCPNGTHLSSCSKTIFTVIPRGKQVEFHAQRAGEKEKKTFTMDRQRVSPETVRATANQAGYPIEQNSRLSDKLAESLRNLPDRVKAIEDALIGVGSSSLKKYLDQRIQRIAHMETREVIREPLKRLDKNNRALWLSLREDLRGYKRRGEDLPEDLLDAFRELGGTEGEIDIRDDRAGSSGRRPGKPWDWDFILKRGLRTILALVTAAAILWYATANYGFDSLWKKAIIALATIGGFWLVWALFGKFLP